MFKNKKIIVFLKYFKRYINVFIAYKNKKIKIFNVFFIYSKFHRSKSVIFFFSSAFSRLETGVLAR